MLAPGILDADTEIKREDEVVVLNPAGEVVCCGRARMSGKEMIEEKRGNAVKLDGAQSQRLQKPLSQEKAGTTP
ncbi:PUA domain-containing protein [Methanosarcina horonobensis]|uniref:PUA domain-containing protein n=1 Tax=Methanosarcina horonobensis TaxID=418008 RepID=UPI002FCDF85B